MKCTIAFLATKEQSQVVKLKPLLGACPTQKNKLFKGAPPSIPMIISIAKPKPSTSQKILKTVQFYFI